MENGVGVGDVNYSLVLCNLGNEVPRVQIVANRHSQSQNEHVFVRFHDLIIVSLRPRIFWDQQTSSTCALVSE